MIIEINLRSLLNLEHICEVLYKLHPLVLDELIEIERSLGQILGIIDLNNTSLEEREFLANHAKEVDFSKEVAKTEKKENELITIQKMKEEKNCYDFYNLLKYIQLNTDEYIPIKISVEVENPVIGKKVRELVRALEQTRAPEQFYLNKKEMDEYAYFAEGYGLTMNEEQKKQYDDFLDKEDVKGLKELLRRKSYILNLIFV